jgi:HSP20 family protein
MNSALTRVPAADIREEPGRFMRYADLPGVDPQDIEVQMERGLPTIEGERRVDASGENGNYSRIERMHGVFHRRFALPDSADPEGLTASGFNGVLQVIRSGFRIAATPQVGSVLQS